MGYPENRTGFSERANIIVDEEWRVVFIKVYPIPELPDIEEVIDFLTGWPPADSCRSRP